MMKAKVTAITIVGLLLLSSWGFAAMTNEQPQPAKHEMRPVLQNETHPLLQAPNEKVIKTPKEQTYSKQEVPEPDQQEYLLWQDNFENEDDIWYYGTPTYVFPCPDEYGDVEFGVRFTARRAGGLIGSWFYWYSGTDGVEATVHVYEDDAGFPGTELGSLPVTPVVGAWNYVDLSTLDIDVTTVDDFFITYTVSDGDTLSIVADNAATGANRSVERYDSEWGYMVIDWGEDYEFCIDAVIEVDQDPWEPSHVDTWEVVTDSSHSPIHSWWIDDFIMPIPDGMNWLISPAFMCPDGYGRLEIEYWYASDFVDQDGDGDGYLEDYWYLYIGKTEDAIDWHSSSYQAYGEGTSWYAGSEDTHLYGENAIYYLYSPDIDLSTATEGYLTCKLQYDTETPGGEDPPYDGWDVANVQISTDGWETYEFLEDPDNPYNVTIAFAGAWNTHNPADTLSYPGWGGSSEGWFDAEFDLSDYVGQTVQIRFALASDPAATYEGFWVDNVDITADGNTIFSDYNEENLIPDEPIVPMEELDYDYGVTDEWTASPRCDITAYQGNEIVIAVVARLDDNHDGGDGEGLWVDDVTIVGSNLPDVDALGVFNVIPYPMTAGMTVSPGMIYGNGGLDLISPGLRIDIDGIGTTPFDFFNNSPAEIATGEYELAWLAQAPTTILAEGTYNFIGWVQATGDADPTNDTTSIEIEILPEGQYELGYNSREWAGTYITYWNCGTYFTPFSDEVLDNYTIEKVKTYLFNNSDVPDESVTVTIDIYDEQDGLPGDLLYSEDFLYTAAGPYTDDWAEFTLTTPLAVTEDFFVIQNVDDPDTPISPLFDDMVRQYIGLEAYYGHAFFWDDANETWVVSSAGRYVNTVGPGTTQGIGEVPDDKVSFLGQNYPNPFTNSTEIRYLIKGNPQQKVEIKIYNVLGQHIDTIEGENGYAYWEPKNVSNGIYFYKLTSGDFSSVKKMVLMR